MARKETITKPVILESAFKLVRERGFEAVTARKLAEAAGCSTQPIFRIYKNMSELEAELFGKAVQFFDDYYLSFPKSQDVPFMDLGLCYVSFAQEETNLFKLLFQSRARGERSMYDLVNGGDKGFVTKELRKIRNADPGKISELFMKIWIFLHGIACMAMTGDYDLSLEETRDLIRQVYYSFMGREAE